MDFNKIPNSIDTKFATASAGKVFVAVAILQLIEKRKLNLDESTMDDYDELWKDYPNYKIRTSKDLLPLFINKPMMYARGEKF